MAYKAKRLHLTSVPNSSYSPNSALASLNGFMDERRKQQKPVADFGAFEEALHERVMGLERELLAEELSRAEVDAEALDRRAKRMTEDGEF